MTIKAIRPPNFGWLEKKLSAEEMKHLWTCVDEAELSVKHKLVGNIHESKLVLDKNGWFWDNTLSELIYLYEDEFGGIGNQVPTSGRHGYMLPSMWVNYQKQGEFNPSHGHTGVYSFVIWMKIPTDWKEQNKLPIAANSNDPKLSSFVFYYTNTQGGTEEFPYRLDPTYEGTMLFFPSTMSHAVYPFLNCEEDRISISGNVLLDTSRPYQ